MASAFAEAIVIPLGARLALNLGEGNHRDTSLLLSILPQIIAFKGDAIGIYMQKGRYRKTKNSFGSLTVLRCLLPCLPCFSTFSVRISVRFRPLAWSARRTGYPVVLPFCFDGQIHQRGAA